MSVEGVTHCPKCGQPAHAAESNDDGVCMRCLNLCTACGLQMVDGVCQPCIDRSWSVRCMASPVHVRAVVRRGVDGQRAMLGSLVFDYSDVKALQHDARSVIDQVVTRVVVDVFMQLGQQGRIDRADASPEVVNPIGEKCRADAWAMFARLAIERFNAVDESERYHHTSDVLGLPRAQ